MSQAWTSAIGVGAVILLAWGAPALGLRMFMPSLETSERARTMNYRGRSVVLGLGVVWLFWLLGVAVAIAVDYFGAGVGLGVGGPEPLAVPSLLLSATVPLCLIVLAVGLLDDALGSADDRGFRGHLVAMLHGRLTTGMLKLIVISLASLYAASATLPVRMEVEGGAEQAAYVLIAGAGIALTSNLLNLTDVRPGRALKVYMVLVGPSALVWVLALRGLPGDMLQIAPVLFVTAGLFLGPAIAAWPYDLRELGILGDAGANTAGAVAGVLVVVSLPLWGVGAYAAIMLALNLASERWSFSAVIEKNRFLSWLDGLGRLPADAPTSDGIGDIKS